MNSGVTVLHSAASKGELEVVKWLVERGADIEARDGRERTPLDIAKEYSSDAEVHDIRVISLIQILNEKFEFYALLQPSCSRSQVQSSH